MDFNNADDYARFMELAQQEDTSEAREFVEDGLVELAEVWMGDTVEDKLARSFIGAMRVYFDAAMEVKEPGNVNPHIMGLWVHSYTRLTSDFRAFAGITKIKKSFEKKGD